MQNICAAAHDSSAKPATHFAEVEKGKVKPITSPIPLWAGSTSLGAIWTVYRERGHVGFDLPGWLGTFVTAAPVCVLIVAAVIYFWNRMAERDRT